MRTDVHLVDDFDTIGKTFHARLLHTKIKTGLDNHLCRQLAMHGHYGASFILHEQAVCHYGMTA
jgi:hypothetical protein